MLGRCQSLKKKSQTLLADVADMFIASTCGATPQARTGLGPVSVNIGAGVRKPRFFTLFRHQKRYFFVRKNRKSKNVVGKLHMPAGQAGPGPAPVDIGDRGQNCHFCPTFFSEKHRIRPDGLREWDLEKYRILEK